MNLSLKHLHADQVIGPYTLLHPLGEGAHAVVWLAETKDKKIFALKLRSRGDLTLDRQFLREFESMRTLRIPGVIRVYEAGLHDHLLWFSMDAVVGHDFLSFIQQAGSSIGQIAHLGAQLFKTLDHLHRAGFIHQDIKPSNALVDSNSVLHLLDFGVADFFGRSEHSQHLNMEKISGTLAYMAPEQLSGLPFGREVDLFAAGLMLYESVDGPRRPPSNAFAWIIQTCQNRPPSLALQHGHVPLQFSSLVDRLLEADPGRRPSAADSMRTLQMLDSRCICPVIASTYLNADWLQPFEAALDDESGPFIGVIEGPIGSGKAEAGDLLHRVMLGQGLWPVHIHGKIESLGGGLIQALSEALSRASGRNKTRTLFKAQDASIIGAIWPSSVPFEANENVHLPSPDQLAHALARTFRLLARHQRLVLIWHNLEEIDPLGRRVVELLAAHCSDELRLLLFHTPDLKSVRSEQLIQHLCGLNTVLRSPPLDWSPNFSALNVSNEKNFIDTCQAGFERLLLARGHDVRPPEAALWPLAFFSAPLPKRIAIQLIDPAYLTSEWVQEHPSGLQLCSTVVKNHLLSHCTQIQRRYHEVADVFCHASNIDYRDLIRQYLLAQRPQLAAPFIRKNALRAHQFGHYTEARDWLLLLDSLGSVLSKRADDFTLAFARARVALRTEWGPSRRGLLRRCHRMATETGHRLSTALLEAEFDLRDGRAKRALISSLTVNSKCGEEEHQIAIHALLLACKARVVLGQSCEIPLHLEKVSHRLLVHPSSLFRVQFLNTHADFLLSSGQLLDAQITCKEALSVATDCTFFHGAAAAKGRLSHIERMLGDRRNAEQHARAARSSFTASGDVQLASQSDLALSTLLLERGDFYGATRLLDRATRQIRGLRLDNLLSNALKVSLDVATLSENIAQAQIALDALSQHASTDDEVPSVIVRWMRSRGDINSALKVLPPENTGYGRILWHLERARCGVITGQSLLVERESQVAVFQSIEGHFSELKTYAHLLLYYASQVPSPTWSAILDEAKQSIWTELSLGSLELNARRVARVGTQEETRSAWLTLSARAKEVNHRPSVREAMGWLER